MLKVYVVPAEAPVIVLHFAGVVPLEALQQFAASSALTQGSAWQSIFALSSTSPFAPLPAQNVETSEVAIELHFADVPASSMHIPVMASQAQPLAASHGDCAKLSAHDMVAAERNEVCLACQNGTCTCMQGFIGTACDRLQCTSDCNGRGACINTPECVSHKKDCHAPHEFRIKQNVALLVYTHRIKQSRYRESECKDYGEGFWVYNVN